MCSPDHVEVSLQEHDFCVPGASDHVEHQLMKVSIQRMYTRIDEMKK